MIGIIDYGVGNLFSLRSSFAAIGCDVTVSRDPSVLSACERIVLPGVGAFGDAAQKLQKSGLADFLIEEAKSGKPLLGICLGMQLLFEKSFEYGEHQGLGLIKGEIRPIADVIPADYKIPHIGWNALHFERTNCPLFRYLKEGDADCVVCDEEEGAYLATRHLIEGGHKKLAYISSTRVVYSSEQRIKGFLRACNALGIPESDRTIRVSNASILSRQQARGWQVTLANELRELKRQGFDGLFVFCDVEAWHALEVITNTEDLHMEDFGIVSFDNLEKALSYPVSICSVGCDYEEMARRCVELLRARIHRDTCPPRTVVCPVSLQCRKSCQKHRTSPDYRSGEAHTDID
jgi:glutamine amidotransferase